MSSWTYSLKCSLRSLARELVRNFWGRHFVYPALAANERSHAALSDYAARRARKLGVRSTAIRPRWRASGPALGC
jgi:phenylacetate-CoA ligase